MNIGDLVGWLIALASVSVVPSVGQGTESPRFQEFEDLRGELLFSPQTKTQN